MINGLVRSVAVAAATLSVATMSAAVANAAEDVPPRDQLLSPTQALRDVEIAQQTLSTLHAGYDRYVAEADLDALWAALRDQAEEGMTRGDLYAELSLILAAIRCDHTKAEIPEDMEEARNETPTYLPFRFKLFDGRMYVDRPAEGVDLVRQEEILTIDGTPVATLLEEILPFFPVDGGTDFVKEPSLSEFDEFVGPAFDHFYVFLRPLGAEVALTVRGEDGAVRDITAPRLSFKDFSAITGEVRFGRDFIDNVRFEPIGKDAAYLAVDTFVNYRRPVDPDTLYAPIFEQLRAEGRDKLIVDLRRNGGGSDDAAYGLLSWITDEPLEGPLGVWTRMDRIDEGLKPFLQTWDRRILVADPAWFTPLENGYFELNPQVAGVRTGQLSPKEGAFDGELILLTSTDNASGVTHLLTFMKGAGRGTLVGEPTGGSTTGATAGVLLFLNLPESGIKVRVPLFRTVMPHGEMFDPRLGLTPDILAVDTKESYFAGEDPALEAAYEALGLE